MAISLGVYPIFIHTQIHQSIFSGRVGCQTSTEFSTKGWLFWLLHQNWSDLVAKTERSRYGFVSKFIQIRRPPKGAFCQGTWWFLGYPSFRKIQIRRVSCQWRKMFKQSHRLLRASGFVYLFFKLRFLTYSDPVNQHALMHHRSARYTSEITKMCQMALARWKDLKGSCVSAKMSCTYVAALKHALDDNRMFTMRRLLRWPRHVLECELSALAQMLASSILANLLSSGGLWNAVHPMSPCSWNLKKGSQRLWV